MLTTSREFQARDAFQYDIVWVELDRLIAIVCGVFLLRGHNWARWVALAWIAFHVVVSAFHTFPEFAIHCLFCAVIAWFLFSSRGCAVFSRCSGRTYMKRKSCRLFMATRIHRISTALCGGESAVRAGNFLWIV